MGSGVMAEEPGLSQSLANVLTVYADGVANLSRGPGVVKFYLARFDPDPSDANKPIISTMAGQVVMSAVGFAATTIFSKATC
jgi:hypothetical protein